MDKPVLLMLPGLLCTAALWRHQTESLSNVADCRVVDMTLDDTMEDMARRVLADAPPSFNLCGLSMGGYCALEIMRQAPGRVERLALLDTTARPDSPDKAQGRRDFVARTDEGDFEAVLELLLPLYVHERRVADNEIFGVVRQSAVEVGAEAFLRQQVAIISRRDTRPILAGIDCPTLVLCGREDRLTPLDCHEEMAAEIRGARLVVVEDCGHLAPLEAPEETTAALREWLLA